jgi:hypothetical protein
VRDAWRNARAIEDRYTGSARAFLPTCAGVGRVAASVLDDRNLQASGKTMQFLEPDRARP